MRFVKILVWLLIAFSCEAKEILSGQIAGIVVDNVTQQPLPGVNVFIVGAEIGTATDMTGSFTLTNLRPGSYHVRFQMMGYEPQTKLNLPVSPGRTLHLTVGLVQTVLDLQSVVVTPDFFKKAKDAVVSDRTLDFTEIINDPGSSMDVQRMMQSLPSVVSGSDQYNEIVVRGGAPGENLFVLDHIEIPNPNHFGEIGTGGGPIGMINPLFINEVDFYAGSFPARYGDKASSVMDISLREGDRKKRETSLDMGMAGIGVLTEGPLAKGRGSYLLSYHKSFLDLIIANTGLTAVPYYYNAQGKFVFDLNRKHKLIWNTVYGNDHIDLVNQNKKAARGAENVNVKGHEWATGLSWKALWDEQTYSILTAYAVENYWWYRVFHNDGSVYSRTTITETDLALKGDFVHRFSNNGEITTGFSLKNCRGDYLNWYQPDTIFGYGYYLNGATDWTIIHSLPALASIDSFIIVDTLEYPQPTDIDEKLNTYKSALHLQYKWSPINPLTIIAGIRLDYFHYTNFTSLAPRVGLSYNLTPVTKLNLGFGRHYQTPLNVFMAYNSANKNLRSKYSDQVVLGIEHLLARDFRATFEIYTRRMRDIPVLSSALTPDSMDNSEMKLVNAGKAHVEGLEFFIQKKLYDRFHWIFSYSYYIAKENDPRYPGKEYNAPFDYRHVLTFVFGYKEKLSDKEWYKNIKTKWWYQPTAWLLPFGDEVEFSLRWRYLGGKPYNRLSYDPWTRRWYISAKQELNTERFPACYRLDFRLNRRFIFNKVNLVTYIEVQNVLNRDNIWDYSYNSDGTKETVYQYKLFPVGGFILEF